MSKFPPVSRVELQYRRDEQNLALRIKFAEPLSARQAGNVFMTVGDIIKDSERVCELEFPDGAIVVLQPLANQGTFDHDDYRHMVQSFGYQPPEDQDFPIVGEDQTSTPDTQELVVVAPEVGYVH